MVITTLGNCQTMALCRYIRILKPGADVKFCTSNFIVRSHLFSRNREMFGDQVDHVIEDMHEQKQRLTRSDFVLYQAMKLIPAGAHELTQAGLRDTNQQHPDMNMLSVTSFKYNDDDPSLFEGMLTREHKNNVDIRATDIINKHPGKINGKGVKYPGTFDHPNAFYFLEVMREICTRWDWDYYSDEQYEQLIEQGYPFG